MNILFEPEEEIVRAIAKTLKEKREKLAVAESCTGGAICSALTRCEGASSWFVQGHIAYTYEAKKALLGIPPSILDKGLLTRETATAMVENIASLSGTAYGLATTGCCGPASAEARVPLYAWVAVYDHGQVHAEVLCEKDCGRQANIRYVTEQALRLLLSHLR